MLEDDLLALADRVAQPARPDLPDRVLARLDEEPASRWRRAATAAVAAALLAALGLSPGVRAFAADLLERVGIVVSGAEPDASPTPDRPLPDATSTDLERAAWEATFPLSVPTTLADPARVTLADGGRVVSMRWPGVVLDQFDGSFGPVFEKQIGDLDVVPVDLDGVPGWWIPGPHDLMYVDRDGEVDVATARLAGRTLIWESEDGVSFRLEGEDLSRGDAVAIGRSMAGTS